MATEDTQGLFDAQLRARLLRHARQAIVRTLGAGDEAVEDDEWPPLEGLEGRGLFVTLRKGRRLRGCVGTLDGSGRLPDTLRRIAAAAIHDPRFLDTPVGSNEVGSLRIEISVLSALRRIVDPMDFELGVHGLYMKCNGRTGLLLPQVAIEHGWDKERFLNECCAHKAGLDADSWRDGRTEIFVFTVERFGDEGD